MAGGTATIAKGSILSVATWQVEGGTVSLAGGTPYWHHFTQSGGTIELDGQVTRLSGAAAFTGGTIDGPGSMVLGGSAGVSTLRIEDGAVLNMAGTVSDTGTLTLAGTASAIIGSGGLFKLGPAGSIAGAGATKPLINQGLLEKVSGGGTSLVGTTVNNNGTIAVSSGLLDFQGAVWGKGKMTIAGGATLEIAGGVGAGTVTFGGAGGTLALGKAAGFAATIFALDSADRLDLLTFGSGTTASFAQHGATGTLTVAHGSQRAQLTLFGQFANSFTVGADGHGGSLISYTPTLAQQAALSTGQG